MRTPNRTSIPFAGSSLGEHRHVCAFFSSRDDEYRVLIPFTRDGIANGDRIVHVVSGEMDDHVRRLREGGIGVDLARTKGQLDLLVETDVYTPQGFFDGKAMLDRLGRMLNQGRELGFALTRVWAHVDTTCAGSPHAFMEYEALFNDILPPFSDPVVCVYDTNVATASVVFDALRTHPVAIVGDVLQVNPFYVPPVLLLSELAERRAPPAVL